MRQRGVAWSEALAGRAGRAGGGLAQIFAPLYRDAAAGTRLT